METFFITGLPRSRTAWLANFLTQKDSFCFHEAFKYKESIIDLFSERPERYIGNSDSSILLFSEKVKEMFPNGKFVLIKRPLESVMNSMHRLTGNTFSDVLQYGQIKLEQFEKEFSPLVINFEDLTDEKACRDIQQFCTPSIPFDYRRWQMLDKLKVEVTDKELRSVLGGLSCHYS